jgi:hypothetical protein
VGPHVRDGEPPFPNGHCAAGPICTPAARDHSQRYPIGPTACSQSHTVTHRGKAVTCQLPSRTAAAHAHRTGTNTLVLKMNSEFAHRHAQARASAPAVQHHDALLPSPAASLAACVRSQLQREGGAEVGTRGEGEGETEKGTAQLPPRYALAPVKGLRRRWGRWSSHRGLRRRPGRWRMPAVSTADRPVSPLERFLALLALGGDCEARS